MWGITLKGILAHRVRYALTALAILLGVSFISGTFVLTDTINSTFNSLYQQIYQGTAAVVRATQPFDPGLSYTVERQRIDASVAGPVSKVPGVRAVALDIEGYAQLVGKSGKPIGVASNGPPTIGMAWTSVAELSPLRLLPGGQPPRGPGQVVIDKHSADIGHFKVGDKVRVLTKMSPGTYTISGLATWGTADSPLGASIAAFTPATAAQLLGQPGKVSQLDVAAEPGVSQDTLVARIQAAIHDPGIEVVSGQSVTAEGQQSVHQALSFFGTFLLTFGFIALFVGAFVIFNTFSIVVAQRLRELALLRAVGASRRQVFAAVLGESLVVGLGASAAGLAAGIGLAVALKAGLSALGMDLPATGLVVSTRTVMVGLLAGVAVTVVSAISPARRASRIPPVAALQDVAAEPRRPLVRRTAVGVVFTFGGLLALGTGLFSHLSNRMPLVGIGASALFIGIAALGPFVARPVCRLLGAPLARFGASGKLGQQNAMRNPSRAAATAAALMVGVSLVSMTTVMASSVKASANSVIDSALRADFVLSSGAAASSGGGGFSPAVEPSLAALPGVADVAGIRAGVVKVFGRVTPVVAADPVKAAPLFNLGITQGSLAAMSPTGIGVSARVASDRHLRLGSPVTLMYPTTGTKTYTVQVIYSVREIAGDYVLPLAAAQANFPQGLDVAAFIKLAPGVSTGAARPAIDRVLAAYPNVTLQDQAQYKAQQAQQVNQLLNLVYGLLALAVVIALIGIANTLALSIYERTHELGLLRAVGATRGQLRAVVRYESLVISLFGAVEGLALGTLFGWAIVAALHSQGVTRLVFPVTQLITLAVLAGVAGIVAAFAPSRRAARLNVLRAVTTE
ncbi:FtsX-like permease family protein [Trebonia kvetii]|uniref:FtsX-like permease family protein n=1 Tax=Trebonia kvetii TaxID=2480626 RepID=A0A6P2BN19_9ACTN|nr:ABC transporter permease [Trebonia kvetii]TVY99070.1 FtsX-like permease family protein [Trebonia kvetii]